MGSGRFGLFIPGTGVIFMKSVSLFGVGLLVRRWQEIQLRRITKYYYVCMDIRAWDYFSIPLYQ